MATKTTYSAKLGPTNRHYLGYYLKGPTYKGEIPNILSVHPTLQEARAAALQHYHRRGIYQDLTIRRYDSHFCEEFCPPW